MRRLIKKQCIIMATLCMALGIVGCGGSNSGNDAKSATQATVQENKDEAKNVYKELNDAVTDIDALADDILNIWHYAIFDASGYTDLYEISVNMGVDYSTLVEVNNKTNYLSVVYIGDKLEGSLTSFSDAIACYIDCRQTDGSIDKINQSLNNVKDSIKSIPESASYYSKLKEYYIEANSFYEFCLSPTGNYDDAGNKVEEFRSKCQGYKSDLSFDLE